MPLPRPEGFTLLDNKDILAANGLYYASWVNGDAQPYENSEGKTVDLYDAQLTLVVQENKTEEKAASAVSGWQELAQQNYDISDTQTLTAAGQDKSSFSAREMADVRVATPGIFAKSNHIYLHFGFSERSRICFPITRRKVSLPMELAETFRNRH